TTPPQRVEAGNVVERPPHLVDRSSDRDLEVTELFDLPFVAAAPPARPLPGLALLKGFPPAGGGEDRGPEPFYQSAGAAGARRGETEDMREVVIGAAAGLRHHGRGRIALVGVHHHIGEGRLRPTDELERAQARPPTDEQRQPGDEPIAAKGRTHGQSLIPPE